VVVEGVGGAAVGSEAEALEAVEGSAGLEEEADLVGAGEDRAGNRGILSDRFFLSFEFTGYPLTVVELQLRLAVGP
jgi:hypothetical protein